MIKGQGLPYVQPGTCQVSNDDIVFQHGTSAQGAWFDYAVSTPWFATYGAPTFFRVTRVVGPGLPAEFVPGTPGAIVPANWAIYTQNGVVSPTARVEVQAGLFIDSSFYYNTHPFGGSDPVTVNATVTFTLNGTAITQPIFLNATVTSPTTVTQSVPLCVTVNASLVRFGSRLIDPSTSASIPCADQQQTETTCPGINEVEALTQADHATGGLNFVNQASKIIFRAMAPVVMIHGWRSSPQFFAAGSTGSGTLPFQQPFEKPFMDAKIPYDRTLDPNQYARLGEGRDYLVANLKAVVDKFGAKECHLVAHSKGGLWTRGALPRLQDLNVGVLSFTTLDAPNKGAFLADFMLYGRQYIFGSPDLRNIFGLLASFALLHGADDLTRDGVADFNLNTADPPDGFTIDGVFHQTKYYSVASDADLDGNGFITGAALYQNVVVDEKAPYPGTASLWNLAYKLTGHSIGINPNRTFSIGHWEFSFPHWAPFATFQPNDLIVVAAEAASYIDNGNSQERFTLIPNAALMKHNHSTVGRADTAQAVISAIQYAQPVQ
jgi:hypothetical protein